MVGKKILKYSFIFTAAVSVLSFAIIPLLKTSNNLTDIGLPIPGAMVNTSEEYVPVYLKGLKLDPNRPDQIDFYIDTGSEKISENKLKEESDKLVDYFLASLTVPAEDLWVNLSPYEKDRIIPDALGDTDMGAKLLAQDYILKQLTASLSDPQTKLGKEYWRQFNGQSKNQSTAFNKVWIVPETARVVEHDGVAVIAQSSLKAMMENDYNALKHNQIAEINDNTVMRDKMLPLIEQEVNAGKNFAPLRQAYSAMILSNWFKKSVRGHAAYDQYRDSSKTQGIASQDQELPSKIYVQYVDAFDKGVYKYVKTEKDINGNSVKRQYLSGGFAGAEVSKVMASAVNADLVNVELNNTVGESRIATYEINEIKKESSAIEEFKQYIKSGSTVPLDEKIVGLKSKNQIISKNQLDLPVPEFAIVTTDFMRDNTGKEDVDWLGLAEAILQDPEIQKIPDGSTLAIRPAGEINMPGLAETIKGIKKDPQALAEVLKKIAQDWSKSTVESYRRKNGIAENSMFAFMIQREVMGNKNNNSGAGVFYTRDPQTGDSDIVGNYCINAPGEYIRNGEGDKEYKHVEYTFEHDFPEIYKQMLEIKKTLELHFGYPQEVEFVIEDGKLFIVQTVNSDVSPIVEADVLKDMVDEGIIPLSQLTASLYNTEIVSVYDLTENERDATMYSEHKVLSDGAMAGKMCLNLSQASKARAEGHRAVVVSPTFTDSILQAVIHKKIDGLILTKGSFSMHSARIAREMGVPVIVMDESDVEFKGSSLAIRIHKLDFSVDEFIAFDEMKIQNVSKDSIQDKLKLRKEYEAKKVELQTVEKIKDDVVTHLVSENMDYYKATFLHGLLYANVLDQQYNEELDTAKSIALDLVTTAVHDYSRNVGQGRKNDGVNVNNEITRLKDDLTNAIEKNPAFKLSTQELADVKSPSDFLKAIDAKLNWLIDRYRGLDIKNLVYPNFKIGRNEYASQDSKMYLEFSLEYNPKDGSMMNFDGESVEAINLLNEMEFYVRYQNAESHGRWSSQDSEIMPDLKLVDVNIFADPGDKTKLRVSANIPFPEYSSRVTFSLMAKNKGQESWMQTGQLPGITVYWKKLITSEERVKHIVSSNKIESTSPKQYFSDKKKLINDAYELTAKSNTRYRSLAKRNMKGHRTYTGVGLYDYVDQNVSMTLNEDFYIGKDNDKLVLVFESSQYKQISKGFSTSGYYEEVNERDVSDELRLHLSALSAMLNTITANKGSRVEELDWFYEDRFGGHDMESIEYSLSRWLSVDKSSFDFVIAQIYDLQEEIDIGQFFSLDTEGNVREVEFEKAIAFLYDRHEKESSRALKGGFDFSGAFLTIEGVDTGSVYGDELDNTIGQLLGLEPQLLAIKDKDDQPIFTN